MITKYYKQAFFAVLKVTYAALILGATSSYAVANTAPLVFSKGELITFDIKKLKIKVGEATLSYNGLVPVDGQELLSITFMARGFKFRDEERIYLDPKTFYPVLIKRDLNIFGSEEQITEFYDTQKGKVRIVKEEKGKTSDQIIEQGGRFDNIYGFIYRQRQSGEFVKSKKFQLHLPTSDVSFQFNKKVNLKISDQKFNAYYIQSTPKKYEVWFDSNASRIPLKIVGALGYGNFTMEFANYTTVP